MQDTGIERFFLYGEPARPAAARFVHLEKVDDRSRPANWVIRPHAHADLHHIFYLDSGGGRGEADGRVLLFEAPCLVITPAGIVHGFRWREDTAGRVLTFSDSFMRLIAAGEAALLDLFARGMWSAAVDGGAVADAFARLEKELGWAAAAHELAVAANLATILVETLRLNERSTIEAHAPPGPQALLVARYRALVDAHFREHPSVEWSAANLGVSPSRLRAACRAIAGASPIRLLQDRLKLEAERVMRYSNMSVGQVALYLGFADPAYFSRFFARECGASPRTFRAGVRI
jgi:AraC family transcriptional activator of pobA